MTKPAPERTPPDDITEGMNIANLRIKLFAAVGGDPPTAQAVWDVVSPALERYRKAVDDAPGGAIWTGACVECGEAIESGDAITWRLRWSPQGPIHEECRRPDDTTEGEEQ